MENIYFFLHKKASFPTKKERGYTVSFMVSGMRKTDRGKILRLPDNSPFGQHLNAGFSTLTIIFTHFSIVIAKKQAVACFFSD